ncbi:MAG: hypothetical protein ACOC29_00335 [Candidatus Sumerlaeota bacterium]
MSSAHRPLILALWIGLTSLRFLPGNEVSEMSTIVFGDRQITIHVKTPAGTPVAPMWAAYRLAAEPGRL